jgi:hypothetical protein
LTARTLDYVVLLREARDKVKGWNQRALTGCHSAVGQKGLLSCRRRSPNTLAIWTSSTSPNSDWWIIAGIEDDILPSWCCELATGKTSIDRSAPPLHRLHAVDTHGSAK